MFIIVFTRPRHWTLFSEIVESNTQFHNLFLKKYILIILFHLCLGFPLLGLSNQEICDGHVMGETLERKPLQENACKIEMKVAGAWN